MSATDLQPYFFYLSAPTSTNTNAAAPPLDFMASKSISFQNTDFVSTEYGGSWVDTQQGAFLCVAPVLSPSLQNDLRRRIRDIKVSYWAVDKNCCFYNPTTLTTEFSCSNWQYPGLQGEVLEPTSPDERLNVPGYLAAVQQVVSNYHLQINSSDPNQMLLVRWTGSHDKTQHARLLRASLWLGLTVVLWMPITLLGMGLLYVSCCCFVIGMTTFLDLSTLAKLQEASNRSTKFFGERFGEQDGNEYNH
jgi:hypothetical protein